MIWIERQFKFELPLTMYPNVLERLRGTPARLEDRLGKLEAQVLVSKINDQWSIQEHAGHLLDLEPLSLVRLDDYAAGRSILVAADITNRKTHEAGHNLKPLQSILSSFRLERERLVGKLESLDESFIQRTAIHPKLNIPMRVIDFAFFMAEHDDHHLARISDLIRNTA